MHASSPVQVLATLASYGPRTMERASLAALLELAALPAYDKSLDNYIASIRDERDRLRRAIEAASSRRLAAEQQLIGAPESEDYLGELVLERQNDLAARRAANQAEVDAVLAAADAEAESILACARLEAAGRRDEDRDKIAGVAPVLEPARELGSALRSRSMSTLRAEVG